MSLPGLMHRAGRRLLSHGEPLARLVEERDGARNNLDLIRLLAATMVLVSHAFPLSGDSVPEPLAVWSRGQATFGGFAVAIFFFISGFLVTRSLMRRNSLLAFALARCLRIFPALAVAVALSALLLGPLFTTLSWSDYFTHSGFASYFRNILLEMRYALPGVFAGNANGAVNGSLWTLEYEAGMYLALPAVIFAASVLSRHILPAALLLLIGIYHFHLTSPAVDGFGFYYYVHLGQFFLAGTIAFVYRDLIPISTPLAMLCLGLTVAGAMFGGFFLARLIAGGYVLLWFAYGAPKIADPVTRLGDLSYGIYIYAFPMQQVMAESFAWGRSWEGNMLLSLPPTFLLAYLSWRWVEAPAMAARSRILAALTRRSGHAPPMPAEIEPAAAGLGARAQGTQ